MPPRYVFSVNFRKETAMIFGLANSCPYNCETMECPLVDIRKLDLKGRYEAIQNMPLASRLEVLKIHRECASERVIV